MQLQVEADTTISGDPSIIAQLERTRGAVHISKTWKDERGRGDMNRQQQGKVHPVQAGGAYSSLTRLHFCLQASSMW